jgi:hypothetical protein
MVCETRNKSNSKSSKSRRSASAGSRASEEAEQHIIERPDGFYLQSATGAESGPFATLAEAEAGLLSSPEDDLAGESLQEAESEVGMSSWIDPDTGGPAEDSVPHIEDH